MSPKPRFALLVIAVASCALSNGSAQQTLRGRTFTDKTNGYRITIPAKWVRMPTNVEEKWIIAHFNSNKNYTGSAKAGDSLMGHKPYMKVVIFDDAVIKKMVDVEKEGDTTIKTLNLPYRDYKDYVRRNLGGGGYYYAEEEKGEVKGVKVMKYQVKLEKLATDKKRYIAWVFAGQGVKFAVEFEVLESQYKKLASKIMASLGTFKFVERSGKKAGKEAAILKRSFSRDEWAKMPAKERLDIRRKIDKAREKKMLARLPEGWTFQRSKHFLVLSHGSKRFTKRIVDAAEAFRTFLNRRFDEVSDEYAMKAVIRICKNEDEYRSYYSGSSETGFNFLNREIVTYNDYTNVGLNSGSMFWDIYGFYMKDKAPQLLFNAPIWLESGLNSYVLGAVLKGRKLVFQRTVREFGDYAMMRRSSPESIKTGREIMNLDSIMMFGEDGKQKKREYLGSQVATFFRFLEGPGKRVKHLKNQDFLIDYMRAVLEVSKQFDDRGGIVLEGMKEATTEAEEEQMAERSRERWKEYAKQAKARRAEFLVALAKKLDPWTDDQWVDLEKGFLAYHSKKTR